MLLSFVVLKMLVARPPRAQLSHSLWVPGSGLRVCQSPQVVLMQRLRPGGALTGEQTEAQRGVGLAQAPSQKPTPLEALVALATLSPLAVLRLPSNFPVSGGSSGAADLRVPCGLGAEARPASGRSTSCQRKSTVCTAPLCGGPRSCTTTLETALPFES